MTRVPTEITLLEETWSYHLPITEKTLQAVGGTLDREALYADAERRIKKEKNLPHASLPTGCIILTPNKDGFKVVVNPLLRHAGPQEAVLTDHSANPIGVIVLRGGKPPSVLFRASRIGIDLNAGLPVYMAP